MHKWWIIRQALLPALLFTGAIASLVYGAIYHSVPVERNTVEVQIVQEEHEEEREFPIPGMGPGGPGFPDGGMGPPGDVPPFGSPLPFPGTPRPKVKVTVIQSVEKKVLKPVVEDEPEAMIVFEVTRGGVLLAESGVLTRTYGPTASGDEIPPPSRCPT